MMLAKKSALVSSAQPCIRQACSSRRVVRGTPVRALDDTNIAISLLSSASAAPVVAGITIAIGPNRDAEVERITTIEGATPLVAALGVDAIAHSIPGLNVVLNLLAEPAGAVAGVAFMMSILLSAKAIDPSTLAPKGTVLNAETANDISAGVRVPFTQIIPTVVKVIDWENEGSSGKGWSSADGLPRLPINSVLIVLGIGATLVELLSHAPLLSQFMPRVLTVAAWYAGAGYFLDKRD